MADYRIFPATNGPATSGGDGTPVNLAVETRTTGRTWFLGLLFYRGTLGITGDITGRVFTVDSTSTGTPVPGTDVAFVLDGLGWQFAAPAAPVELSPDVRHKPTVHFPDQFPITPGFWGLGGAGESGIVNGPLRAYGNVDSVAGQGSFSTGSLDNYPAGSVNSPNYWVDMLITDVEPVSEIRVVLNLAVETDTAHAVTVVRVVPLALAAETDTAPVITASRRVVLDLATEVDTAHVLASPIGIDSALLAPGLHTASSAVAGLTASSSVSGLEASS